MFDSLEENYFNPQPQLQVPQTLPEALRLAADLADDRDKERNGRLIAEQQVNELKPKADYYDHILANKGLVTTTSIAKTMVGQRLALIVSSMIWGCSLINRVAGISTASIKTTGIPTQSRLPTKIRMAMTRLSLRRNGPRRGTFLFMNCSKHTVSCQ